MRESKVKGKEINSQDSSKINPSVEPTFNSLTVKNKVKGRFLGNSQNNSLILGILIGVITTFVGLKLMEENPAQTTANSRPVVTASSPTVSQTITTTEVTLTQVAETIFANGTVTARELVPVMSQADSLQIKQILVDEGDLVNQGQTLIRLDDQILQAELKQAQASVTQAQARLAELKAGARQEELQRAREKVKFAMAEVLQAESDLALAETRVQRNRQLEAEGAIAQDRLDEFLNDKLTKQSNLAKAKARLQEEKQQLLELETGVRPEIIAQAQANLAEAQGKVSLIQAKLAETNVTAPVSGKIAERNARVGDVTSAFNSQKLFTIIEAGKLELQLRVPETQLNQIKQGQKVKVTSSSNPDLNLTGIVTEIAPVIDAESRQGIVKVDLPNRDDLQPGMFLQAEIITSTQPRLTVPMNAVLPQNDGTGKVFLLQSDNRVKAQTVTLGEMLDGDLLEILAGLSGGEKIAVKGLAYLKDGDLITVAN